MEQFKVLPWVIIMTCLFYHRKIQKKISDVGKEEQTQIND